MTNELSSVIDKWFRIGIQLGLDESKLSQIEADHHGVDRCFSEVISFWLKGNTQIPVTWESLIEMLETSFVNEKGLSKRLRGKGGFTDHLEVLATASSSNDPIVGTDTLKPGLTSSLTTPGTYMYMHASISRLA